MPRNATGTVVHCSAKEVEHPKSHNRITREWIAARVARLLGYEYAGEYEASRRYAGHLYFVPGDTLLADAAQELGIRDERDLFGGVVPHSFLTTKTIAHPLIDKGVAPQGWQDIFSSRLADAVLDGYSAFTKEDARRAGRLVLEGGSARVKDGEGIGGSGQTVVSNASELDAAIEALDERALALHGVVVEQNLENVTTYSVGRVKVGEGVASYAGTQGLTTNNKGHEVYGGSDLTIVRGDYEALLRAPLPPQFRKAVELARTFDAVVSKGYPRFVASRRNYDIAEGNDAQGKERIGVLEQSWRIGGASAAEIRALEAFRDNPEQDLVQTCCVEAYGGQASVPPEATVYFQGIDDHVGPLTKYVLRKDHGSQA